MLDPGADPLEELERRERDSYVQDALHSLPDRLKAVLVGYFLEGRTSIDLARFLGVTESRVSQLRSEALTMLRDGINAQYDPEDEDEDEGDDGDAVAGGRVAKRKANFAAAVGSNTSWRDRLDAPNVPS